MHTNEVVVAATMLLATRFFLARLLARLGFKVYEAGMAMIPSGHPVRIYSEGRMKESRQRALPMMRPTRARSSK